jgi:hypothetical protein
MNPVVRQEQRRRWEKSICAADGNAALFPVKDARFSGAEFPAQQRLELRGETRIAPEIPVQRGTRRLLPVDIGIPRISTHYAR